MYLIGGGQYSPLAKKIVSSDADEIVGYNKNHGTYARLFAEDYAGKQGTIHCDATQERTGHRHLLSAGMRSLWFQHRVTFRKHSYGHFPAGINA